jgi:hypothetical protein
MVQMLLIGLGAGACSALLFASVASGSMLSIGLFYLAPLPILLAGIVWGHAIGLTAVGAAALALLIALGRWYFIAHLVAVGLPSYFLAYFALLARQGPQKHQLEWYPVGRLVLWGALLAAGSSVISIPAFGFDLESYRATLRAAFERVLRAQTATPAGEALRLPGGNVQAVLDLLVIVIPPSAAVLSMVTSLGNLWLAGRIALLSGRLKRPWPDIAGMSLPPGAPLVLVAAVAVSFLDNLAGLAASLLTATLLAAYAMLGLAVIHAATRAFPGRALILTAVWLSVFLIGWTILLIVILGLIEPFWNLRARAARRGGPPQLPTSRSSNE